MCTENKNNENKYNTLDSPAYCFSLIDLQKREFRFRKKRSVYIVSGIRVTAIDNIVASFKHKVESSEGEIQNVKTLSLCVFFSLLSHVLFSASESQLSK